MRFWQTGLLVQIGDGFELSYIPLRKQENTVRLAQGEDAEDILANFRARSEQIKDPAFIRDKYAEYAKTMRVFYLNVLSGKKSFLFRAVNKLLGNRLRQRRYAKRYPKDIRLAIQNTTKCEDHRELMLEALHKTEDGE